MTHKAPPVDIIWQDEALLVVDKPAGLPCLVDGYDPQAPYLLGLLKETYTPLWVVHRLDRFTSGVMVFARSAEAHRALNTQFEQRSVKKSYHALVNGSPDWSENTINIPLRPNGDRKHRTVVDTRGGKPATTAVRILERYGRYSLVEACPQTGRTHQIRAHLAARGHPIAADALYGGGHAILLSEIKPAYRGKDGGEKSILDRVGLHAHTIKLSHPTHGRQIYFEAPYPKDFRLALKKLRQYGA